MIKRIKTNIKFNKSTVNGSMVGYVTKHESSWKGCREQSECKKKIVLVDAKIASGIIENVLYRTVLIPMADGNGFIAISATPVLFPAKIESIINDNEYRVEVKFGNKKIVYNPKEDVSQTESGIPKIAKLLSSRMDIEDVNRVVNDFIEAANITSIYYWDSKAENKYVG